MSKDVDVELVLKILSNWEPVVGDWVRLMDNYDPRNIEAQRYGGALIDCPLVGSIGEVKEILPMRDDRGTAIGVHWLEWTPTRTSNDIWFVPLSTIVPCEKPHG